MFDSRPLWIVAGAAALVIALVWWLVMVELSERKVEPIPNFSPYSSTTVPDLYVDPSTGCNYFVWPHTTLPRTDEAGTAMCGERWRFVTAPGEG